MPGSFPSASSGIPNTKGLSTVRSLIDPAPFQYPYAIIGVTRDATGAVLGNCVVKLYRTADDSLAGVGVSDASGNYRFDASSSLTHYAVAYLTGAPDVFGTTVNSLVGT